MPILIKEYENGVRIERCRGKFDDWCILVNGEAPYDRDYFRELQRLGNSYGTDTIYTHFSYIYNNTSDNIDDNVLDVIIPEICLNYNIRERQFVEILYATIYCTMVAEENKAYTRLGKSIKGLAIYQILKENMDIEEACNFTRGLGWREIESLCIERDIERNSILI